MPRVSRILLLLTAAFFSVTSVSRAQLLTADTTTGFTGSGGFGSGSLLSEGNATTQTFSGITSIESLTFRFIVEEPAAFAGTTLDTYFSVWSGNLAVTEFGGPGPGSIVLADIASWSNSGDGYLFFDAAIDLSAIATGLSAATTYGLSIVGDSVTAGSQVRLSGAGSSYGDGNGIYRFGGGVADFSGLTVGPSTNIGNDYAFSASALTPVPEASTIAVLFAVLFIGGLVTLRLRQRRQQAVAGVQA